MYIVVVGCLQTLKSMTLAHIATSTLVAKKPNLWTANTTASRTHENRSWWSIQSRFSSLLFSPAFQWLLFLSLILLRRDMHCSWSSICHDPRQASPSFPHPDRFQSCLAYMCPWNAASDAPQALIHDLVRHKGGLLEFVHLTSVVHDPATSTCAVGVGWRLWEHQLSQVQCYCSLYPSSVWKGCGEDNACGTCVSAFPGLCRSSMIRFHRAECSRHRHSIRQSWSVW